MLACQNGHLEIAEFLLKHGVDKELKNKVNWSRNCNVFLVAIKPLLRVSSMFNMQLATYKFAVVVLIGFNSVAFLLDLRYIYMVAREHCVYCYISCGSLNCGLQTKCPGLEFTI